MTAGFCCPKCKHALVKQTNGYSCQDCKCLYSISKGYVDFLGNLEFYAGEVSQSEMQTLIKEIDALGYEEALHRFLKQNPSLADYITDFRRTDWLCHCLGKNNLRCLDIGSGLGNISHLLSYNFQEVYSLEAVKERIEFQKRKYKNSNRQNITVVRGNALELPFEDNFFDLVICNGLLEWVGVMNTILKPRDTQLSFLREVKRVLSKNGCLYIGIENRFGFQFFLGARDHSGLRYTSLLPRGLASLFVKCFGKKGGIYGDQSLKKKENLGYNTYTYSARGYRSLLQEAGFKFKPYWVYPSYNKPHFSGKLDDKIGMKAFLKNFNYSFIKGKIPLSIIEKLGKTISSLFVSLFTPSFLFYCYKNNPQESVEEIIYRDTNLKNYTTFSTGEDILYLLYDKKGIPVKSLRFKRFGGEFPKKLSFHDKTQPFLPNTERMWLEDWFSAKTVNPMKLEDMTASIDWLINFQNNNNLTPLTNEDIISEVDKIRNSLENLSHFNKKQCHKWIDNYQSYIETLRINKTAQHGDFWHGNILVDASTHKVIVIDWNYFRKEGIPLFDFVFLLIQGMKSSHFILEEFESNLNGTGRFTPIIIELKNKINKHFGFELQLDILIPYVMLCYTIRKQLERGPNDKWVIYYKKILDFLASTQ